VGSLGAKRTLGIDPRYCKTRSKAYTNARSEEVETSPERARDKRSEPDDKTVILRDTERPESERNGYVDETFASGRRDCPGAHRDEQEVSSGVGHDEGWVTQRAETKSLAGRDVGQQTVQVQDERRT
jgi:hypothetical protein